MESKKLKVPNNMMADLIDSGLKYSIKKDGHEENLKILRRRMLGLVGAQLNPWPLMCMDFDVQTHIHLQLRIYYTSTCD